mgnify:CR=1 FL=1
MSVLIFCEGPTQFLADNLSSFLLVSGVKCHTHVIGNNANLVNEFKLFNQTDDRVVVLGCPLLAKLMPLLEEFFHKLPLEKITLWNIDPVPLVYRQLCKFRFVNIIHGSEVCASLWSKIFHEHSTYVNGIYDSSNFPKSTICNFATFRSNEIAFPINMYWGGHTLESFMHEIKKVKDNKLEKYGRELNELVSIPWQQSIIESGLDPLNIRHQRGTMILHHLFSRAQLAKLFLSLNSGRKSQINTSKNQLSYTQDSNSRRNNKFKQSNKSFLKSEYVFSTSTQSAFHDRTARAIVSGALVLEDQFSGYGTEFEKNGVEVVRYSKEGASINPEIFHQEYSEREEMFKKQLNCIKRVSERSNFSAFLKI